MLEKPPVLHLDRCLKHLRGNLVEAGRQAQHAIAGRGEKNDLAFAVENGS